MINASSDRWQFSSEAILEDVVWQNLDALDLKPLDRQRYIQNQVCDLLAIAPNRQLVIIELKNVEDRYLLPQLTRYYSAVVAERPFQGQVNYDLPIRLMAIAPVFHAHNLIDRDYSRLDFELLTFSIKHEAEAFYLKLTGLDSQQTFSIAIPSQFHPYLVSIGGETVAPIPKIGPPPKSLNKLLESLSPEQQAYLLTIRERILQFDERMIEVGRTTSTQYGLRKGEKGIYKTKVCAEFIPEYPGINRPRLMLLLPYPKRERMESKQQFYKRKLIKRLAWAEVWRPGSVNYPSNLQLFFFLGKTRSRYSTQSTLESYTGMYKQLTESDRTFSSVDDLVNLALEEWAELVEETP